MPHQAKRREAKAGDVKKAPLDERLADEARFFKAWFENPMITGAVSPSGRFLARTMARYVDPASDAATGLGKALGGTLVHDEVDIECR